MILDEIGRGTSTYDGLSLAWAVSEHISGQIKCRTLFATHYHQLTELAELLPNVINLNVLVREWADEIVFLHRIVPGGTDKSYGIHVARLAGIPRAVIHRARELLERLETSSPDAIAVPNANVKREGADGSQMMLFAGPTDHFAEVLGKLDLDNMSPMDALKVLKELQEKT